MTRPIGRQSRMRMPAQSVEASRAAMAVCARLAQVGFRVSGAHAHPDRTGIAIPVVVVSTRGGLPLRVPDDVILAGVTVVHAGVRRSV